MTLFSMDKWYGDFLTEEGHYLFFYCTSPQLAGGTQTLLSVCSAHPEKYRAVTHETALSTLSSDQVMSVIATRHGGICFGGDGGWADFKFPGTELSLRFHDTVYAGSDPLRVRGWGGGLEWFPCAVHARVSGTVKLGGEAFSVTGVRGYADFVRSSILPPLAPVRTVLWGRFHENGTSLTYSVIERPSGDLSGRIYVYSDGTIRSFDRVAVDRHEGVLESILGLTIPRAYTLRAPSDTGALTLEVTHGRAAVQSEFVDEKAVPNRIARAAYRWCSKNPRGVKFLSAAAASLAIPGEDQKTVMLRGVSEYVVFGRR